MENNTQRTFHTREDAAVQLRQEVARLLMDKTEPTDELDALLWSVIRLSGGCTFFTAKNLAFSYSVRGNEMFVSRKDKSITRATVLLAFHNALDLQKKAEPVTGPKKLKTFGASYLYPVFLQIGVIQTLF